MGVAVHLGEPGGVDLHVALRRRQRGMAQQLLDGAQVAAAGQQVGGKGMAQRVRRHHLLDSGAFRSPLDHPLDGHFINMTSTRYMSVA